MYRTLKLSLLAGLLSWPQRQLRELRSGQSYVDDTSVVGLWEDATKTTIGQTAEYTNSVELADINGDGMVDILFANGGDYEAPGKPEFSRVFLNQGAGKMFKDVGKDVFGPEPMVAVRAIRVADVNGDGHADILVASSYQTQSRLYLGDGKGGFTDVTANQLPQIKASIGDAKFGDADGDGDLDVILADWGPGSPMENDGGRTMLWLNDGKGRFTDATAERMPDAKVRFSWNLEFVDVDNDFDLDILVSSKKSAGGFLSRTTEAATSRTSRRDGCRSTQTTMTTRRWTSTTTAIST